jgi:uncharacterized membrane protein YcaP (DUF421 family)
MWHSMFHLGESIGEKLLRDLLIYAFLLIALRVRGKRELGQSNTLDLLVLLLVANAVQNGIIGNDNSVTGAILGAAGLFAMNAAFSQLAYRYGWADWLFEGNPTQLIEDGKPVPKALRHNQISLPELRAIARRQGFTDLGEVRSATLETNGVITMFRKDEDPGTYHPMFPGGLRIGKRRRAPEQGG